MTNTTKQTYRFNPDEIDLFISYTTMEATEQKESYPADYSMEPKSPAKFRSQDEIIKIPGPDLTQYYREINQRRQELKAAIMRNEPCQNSTPGLLD